jgi:L-Ala-D/L-Glu epimerase / N-acetyl-D-glutamate racemase
VARKLQVERRVWALREPFVTARGPETECPVIVVRLEEGGHAGRGEAVGVDYHGETLDTLVAQVEAARAAVEGGATRQDLLALLPPGGARNAIDASLWDLEAKQSGRTVFDIAGIAAPHPVATTVTIGIRSLEGYEARARSLAGHPWIKVKVSADEPVAAVVAVRRGAPNARLVVDANQAWSLDLLQRVTPFLFDMRVDLLEQPVSIEDGAALASLDLPIPICADEPANTPDDLPRLVDSYDFVNIKLDKCGGLTAGLEMARAAQAAGLRLMVGCMVGGSLAMAPAMVLAQLCEVADLDGPLLQAEDWPDGIVYRDGVMDPPSPRLWG